MKRLIWMGGLLGVLTLLALGALSGTATAHPLAAAGAAAPPPPAGTPAAQAPAACGTPQTVSGSITFSDPTHVNSITAGGVCGGPASCALYNQSLVRPTMTSTRSPTRTRRRARLA